MKKAGGMNIFIWKLQISVEVRGVKSYGDINKYEGSVDFDGLKKEFEYDPKDETIYWESRTSGEFWTKKKKLV